MQQSAQVRERMEQDQRRENMLSQSLQSLTLGQDAEQHASFQKIQSIEDINTIEADPVTSNQMESQRQKLDELEQMAIDIMEEI